MLRISLLILLIGFHYAMPAQREISKSELTRSNASNESEIIYPMIRDLEDKIRHLEFRLAREIDALYSLTILSTDKKCLYAQGKNLPALNYKYKKEYLIHLIESKIADYKRRINILKNNKAKKTYKNLDID